MITGFLKNNRMELSTGSGYNIGRISARRAWIPLKKRKTELMMMHEITVGCINTTVPFRFGLTKVDQRKNEGSRFRKRAVTARGSVLARLWVPARAVLALLLPVPWGSG